MTALMKAPLEAKALALLTLFALASCTGTLERGSAASGAGGGAGGPTGVAGGAGGSVGAATGGGGATAPTCVQGASFAEARLTLLSDQQYRNVVHDAFGVTFPATVDVTAPPSASGTYSFNEDAQLETTTVQAYQRAADQVASLLLAQALPPCAPGAVNATCVEAYLRATLPLAWRRPVTDAEVAGLVSIFNSAAMDGQARQVQLTLEAALLHPAFLYRSEIGTNGATATSKIQLTPYELASAVSFALLNSSPDAALFAAAKDGTLTQPAVLGAQVARLMALPAVRANLMKKVSYYLDFETLPFIQKDATAYPVFAQLQGTLYQSAQLFLNDIMWSGHFSDLFTSRTVYANQALATAYGLPAVTGTDLQAITTSGDAYGAGLLTQPALLAASNKNAIGDDVIHRGLWVYYNLLCAPVLPPPPANAATVAATIMGSTRQQALTRDTTCGNGCHSRFDPFGLDTLSYDGIGRYRTTDPTTTPPGAPEDDSATIVPGVLAGQGTAPVMITGVNDVAQLFAASRQVSDCAADSLATYTLDHSPDAQASCDLQAIKDRFQQSGSFSDLFLSILTSPAFLTRDP
jgi:Protein of unknown function (DUF1592)/Protein of unknown function (DUF1588)/Protein of unknown function (DUF1595)/Protein of unknown function (DUF1585)/Protein of unknown function (DUF1587)